MKLTKAQEWEGYSAQHNNVRRTSAKGNWRCTKCRRETMFGAFGLCPPRASLNPSAATEGGER
jgi:ribosomal protein L37AE/L43A